MKELPLPAKPVERDLFIVVLSFGKHTVVLSFGKHTPTTSIHIWHVVSQTLFTYEVILNFSPCSPMLNLKLKQQQQQQQNLTFYQ